MVPPCGRASARLTTNRAVGDGAGTASAVGNHTPCWPIRFWPVVWYFHADFAVATISASFQRDHAACLAEGSANVQVNGKKRCRIGDFSPRLSINMHAWEGPMHTRAAYGLASVLALAASAALALDRALDAHHVKPVIQEQAAALMRLGCQDDWECWDRHGFIAVDISITKSEPWRPEQHLPSSYADASNAACSARSRMGRPQFDRYGLAK